MDKYLPRDWDVVLEDVIAEGFTMDNIGLEEPLGEVMLRHAPRLMVLVGTPLEQRTPVAIGMVL